ncbi:MAG: rRNA maturation RNase YbeY [Bacilli bacterium]|nr:rRNA maturation RNase YbeY [Bacilli bacterium]
MNIEVINLLDEKIDELDNLKEFLYNVCKDEKLDNVIFNVIIVNNEEIHKINKEYRGIDRETDVISFALEDDKSFNRTDFRMLGDIYISIDKVRSQSKEYNHSFKRELYFLAVHGLLHLLGYDHMKKEDEIVMFKKQEEVLSRYGIER